MRVLICDDEPSLCEALRQHVEAWRAARGVESVTVDVFHSSEDLLEGMRGRPPYDLAFMDIQFPGELNGLEAARVIREGNSQIAIVFISNYEEYAVDGYRVNALRYFYKPVRPEQVAECLDIAWHQARLLIDAYVMVESRQRLVRVPYKAIRYVESRAHYLEIHLADSDEECLVTRRKLSELLPELPPEMFAQCHRSYIVNLLYVQSIAKEAVTLTDGTYVPVHVKYREGVFRAFRAFFQGGAT